MNDVKVSEEKVFLTRAWRRLHGELDFLLQTEEFLNTYKGAAPRLIDCLEAMEVIAKHATVPLNEEVLQAEDDLLGKRH